MTKTPRVFTGKQIPELFACMPVKGYDAAYEWYEKLFGCPASFSPNGTEAVWELAPHRFLYIEVLPEQAGYGRQTVFLSDLDTFINAAAERGIESSERETYSNGVRKVIYSDPDGNEIGFGGAPH